MRYRVSNRAFWAGVVLVGFLFGGSPAIAQKAQVYTLETLPEDGKPHSIKPTSENVSTSMGMICPYFTNVTGLRLDENGKMMKQWAMGMTSVSLGAFITIFKNGDKYRRVWIFLKEVPKEDATILANKPIPFNDVKLVLMRFKDLLRIGREWRNAGVAQESKTISFTPVNNLIISIEKLKNDPGPSSWSVVNKENTVAFNSGDLAELSALVDHLQACSDWLDKNE